MDATAEQLASLVGLSSKSVCALARRGVMIRGERGKFALEASVRSYCGHLREAVAAQGRPTSSEAGKERARLASAMADKAELANAATRGALIDSEAMAREWERSAGLFASGCFGFLSVRRRACRTYRRKMFAQSTTNCGPCSSS
jgi:phage terminase Nu1 subunit (DNA packaging protein)